jgi:hypothetical protein
LNNFLFKLQFPVKKKIEGTGVQKEAGLSEIGNL